MRKTVSIIDGNLFVNKAVFSGLKLTTSTGLPVGGTYLFLKNFLTQFKELGKPFVLFDGGHSTRRKSIFPEYKLKVKTPKEDKTEDDLWRDECFSFTYSTLDTLLPLLGIPTFRMRGEEADDVAAVISQEYCNKYMLYLCSTDYDWTQLVSPNVTIFRGYDQFITYENFEETMDIPLEQFVLQKSIIGDDSDGIPGIKGIGPAKSKRIIQESLSFEGVDLYQKLVNWAFEGSSSLVDVVKPHLRVIKRNISLIDLSIINLDRNLIKYEFDSRMRTVKPDLEQATEIFKKLEFKSLGHILVDLAREVV